MLEKIANFVFFKNFVKCKSNHQPFRAGGWLISGVIFYLVVSLFILSNINFFVSVFLAAQCKFINLCNAVPIIPSTPSLSYDKNLSLYTYEYSFKNEFMPSRPQFKAELIVPLPDEEYEILDLEIHEELGIGEKSEKHFITIKFKNKIPEYMTLYLKCDYGLCSKKRIYIDEAKQKSNFIEYWFRKYPVIAYSFIIRYWWVFLMTLVILIIVFIYRHKKRSLEFKKNDILKWNEKDLGGRSSNYFRIIK